MKEVCQELELEGRLGKHSQKAKRQQWLIFLLFLLVA